MANPATPEVFATDEAEVNATVDAGAGKHEEPAALGLEPYQWVAVAMLILLGFAFLGAKVHKAIARGLDGQIAAIREQLDEAKQLRSEAEALRAEYETKIAGAEKDAEAMLDNARSEAAGIVEKAEADIQATIARREAMARDKIAAAERSAVEELRAKAADASTAAAAGLIAANHDASADSALAEQAIAKI